MSKKISLVDYMGACGADGKLIGHSFKVMREYHEMLSSNFEVEVITPKSSRSALEGSGFKVTYLDKNQTVRDKMSKIDKVKDFLLKLGNINKAASVKSDLYFFYNIDFSLICYLFLHKKVNRKAIITLFRNDFGGNGFVKKLKAKMLNTVLDRNYLNIYTGKKFSMPPKNSIFTPDYYYEPSKYDAYSGATKKDTVVCLGTMNRFKLLEPTVDAFNEAGYSLHIAGRFYDVNWFSELCEKASSNVLIENKYLSDEEYLTLMSEAKFCIIPYDKNMYNMRTSGVMQECYFTRTVPLTFDWFIEQNDGNGLKVSDLSDITSKLLNSFDYANFRAWCEDEIKTTYNKQLNSDRITSYIKAH